MSVGVMVLKLQSCKVVPFFIHPLSITYSFHITVLHVDSNTVDEIVDDVWLAVCEDKDVTEACSEFTLYCKFETVDRKELICIFRSVVSVCEDKYVNPIMDKTATIEDTCRMKNLD